MKELKLTLEGDRPGLSDKIKSGVRILIESEDDVQQFLFNLQNALVAVYEHEAKRLGYKTLGSSYPGGSMVALDE